MSLDAIFAVAQTQAWQVTAAIVVVGAAVWAFCRRRPHVAYALWVVVLVKCAVPPVWSSSVGVFSWAMAERTVVGPVVNAEHGSVRQTAVAPEGAVVMREVKPSAAAAAFEQPRIAAITVSWGEVCVGVWALGAMGLCVMWLARAGRLRGRIEADAVAVPERVGVIFEHLRKKLGVRRGIELKISGAGIGPGLFGVLRPAVVLPEAMMAEGEEERLRLVMGHELVHARRRDHWAAVLQMVVQAGWWFHPLVWWMNGELERARELSCDEEVVAGLKCEGAAYGQMLLDVVKMRRGLRAAAFAPGVRAVQVTARRLEHVMERRGRLQGRMPRWVWGVVITSGLMLLPGAGLVMQGERARAAEGGTASAPATSQAAKALVFQGIIVERGTGKAIPGAKVTVHRVHPPGSKPDSLKPVAPSEVITTDANGRYSVNVPAEQAAVPDDWIATEVKADGYMTTSWDGWAIGLIERKNKEGDATFGLKEEMYAAQEVHGVLKDEQGNALGHTRIVAFSRMAMDAESDCWEETETDDQGRYSAKVIKGGDIGDVTAYPKDAATVVIGIEKKRGDLGVTVAKTGLRLKGTVLDVAGHPVAGAEMNAVQYYEQNGKFYRSGEGGYTRRTIADEAGRFVFDPMLAGKYGIETSGYVKDKDGNIKQSPGYFVPVHVTLSAESGEVKVQGLPVVHVHTRTVDPRGKPTREVYPPVSGYFGGDFVNAYKHEEENGEGDFELPKGVENAQILMGMMSDEKTIPRYKRGVDGKLRGDKTIELGKLNEDVTNIYIVRYLRAELTVKVVDESGAVIKKFLPHIEYADKSIKAFEGKYSNGVSGIAMHEVPEGGWHADELLPAEEFRVSASAEGYEEAAQTLTLKEGEKREVTLTLKKVKK